MIRDQFPALRRLHNAHPIAYFDGPGGTQVPQRVVDAMSDYLLHHNANTHWVYPTSVETDAMLLAARGAVADFLNATPSEVVFANNMTTGTFHLARALGRAWGPGDFALFAAMLAAACGAFELAVRLTKKPALRALGALVIAGAFLLVWAQLAVGVF